MILNPIETVRNQANVRAYYNRAENPRPRGCSFSISMNFHFQFVKGCSGDPSPKVTKPERSCPSKYGTNTNPCSVETPPTKPCARGCNPVKSRESHPDSLSKQLASFSPQKVGHETSSLPACTVQSRPDDCDGPPHEILSNRHQSGWRRTLPRMPYFQNPGSKKNRVMRPLN